MADDKVYCSVDDDIDIIVIIIIRFIALLTTTSTFGATLSNIFSNLTTLYEGFDPVRQACTHMHMMRAHTRMHVHTRAHNAQHTRNTPTHTQVEVHSTSTASPWTYG